MKRENFNYLCNKNVCVCCRVRVSCVKYEKAFTVKSFGKVLLDFLKDTIFYFNEFKDFLFLCNTKGICIGLYKLLCYIKKFEGKIL